MVINQSLELKNDDSKKLKSSMNKIKIYIQINSILYLFHLIKMLIEYFMNKLKQILWYFIFYCFFIVFPTTFLLNFFKFKHSNIFNSNICRKFLKSTN